MSGIEAHHAERLTAIEAVLAERPGVSAWEITLSLEWSRPWDDIQPYMQRAANGETLAHLVLLETRGRVHREADVPARFYLADRPGARAGQSQGSRGSG